MIVERMFLVVNFALQLAIKLALGRLNPLLFSGNLLIVGGDGGKRRCISISVLSYFFNSFIEVVCFIVTIELLCSSSAPPPALLVDFCFEICHRNNSGELKCWLVEKFLKCICFIDVALACVSNTAYQTRLSFSRKRELCMITMKRCQNVIH